MTARFSSQYPVRYPLAPVIGGDAGVVDQKTGQQTGLAASRLPPALRPTPTPEDAAHAEPPVPEHPAAKESTEDPNDDWEGDLHRLGFEKGREEGYRQGHAQGLDSGRAEGFEAGRKAGLEAIQQEQAEIRRLHEALRQPMHTLRRALSESVVDAAVHLVEKMVVAKLAVDRAALIPVLSDIFLEAAKIEGSGQRLEIRAAPSACPAIRQWLKSDEPDESPDGSPGDAPDESNGERSSTHTVLAPVVIADEQLADGDLQVVLTNDSGDPLRRIEWDALLARRWEAIRNSLGLAR